MRTKNYGCPSINCSAPGPKISERNFSDLPKGVQDEIKKRNLDFVHVKQCSYCGNIWMEYQRLINSKIYKDEIEIIGVDTHISGREGIHWRILNKNNIL